MICTSIKTGNPRSFKQGVRSSRNYFSLSGNGTKRLDTGWTNQGVVNWNDGDFQLNGSTFDNDLTFNILTADTNDIISGSGTFNNNATGTVNKTLGGEIEFQPGAGTNNAGLFDIDVGELEFQTASTTTATGVFDIDPTATLNFTAATHNVANPNAFVSAGPGAQLIIDGSATVNLNASTSLDPDIDLSLSTTLGGTGDLTVNGLFTWSSPGTTIVNIAGGLTTAATGTVSLSGNGTKRLNTGWTNQGVVNWNDGDFQLNGSTFDNDLTFNILTADTNDIISGSGTFNNNATGTLSKLLTGLISVQNGGGFSNAGLVEIGDGTLNFTGIFTQTAGETRLDGGDLQANPTLNGGSLTGGGTVDGQLTVNNATVAPGLSADIIVVAGDLFLNAGSVTNIEIESTSGPGPGGHDQIQVNGTANLDGTLNVTLLGGFEPVGADNFTAIAAISGVVGTFATENAPAGKILTVDYNSNDVVLSGIIDNVFTIFWDNQTGNDLWTDPLNWDTDLLPVPADDVFIGIVDGQGVFITSGVQSISSVLSDEDIIINGGTFTIANSSQRNGNLTVGNSGASILNGAGDVTVAGLTVWSGNTSTIGGGGTLFADGGLDIAFGGGTSRNLDRTIEMSGTSTWTSTGGSNLNGSGQVVNQGTLNATNSATINVNTGFDNTVGTITKSAGAGELSFSGAFNNDNQVTIDAGTVALASTNTHTGGFTVNPGGTLRTTAGTSTMNGAAITGGGTVFGSGGTLVVNAGSLYNVGDTQLNGGTMTFNTRADTVTLTVGPSGASLLNGTGDVIVSGLTTWSGNTSRIEGSGTLVAGGGLDIDFGGGTSRTLERTVQMIGTSTWTSTGGSSLNGGGQVVNLGTLNATNSSTINVNAGFDNTTGTITKSAGVGELSFNGAFNNDNQVTVDAGTVNLSSTNAHTGVFTLNAGGTLRTSANTSTMTGATVSGAGSVLSNGGVLVIDGASTYNVGDTQINGGTITFNTSVDTTTLTVGVSGAAVLNGTGDVTVPGLTVWSGNTSTIGGSGTLFADGGLDIDFGGGTSRNLDRTIQMSGTNTWTATGGSSFNGSGQVVNLGTLNATNSSTININTRFDNTTGTITKSAGAGELSFNSVFNNDNQVTVDVGTVNLSSTNVHTGVFTLNAGGTLRTSANTSTMTGATVSGAGSVLSNGGVLVIDGASTYNVGDTTINGGTITFNTNVNTTTLTVGPSGAAVLNGTGDVTVSGLTVWSGNTSTIGGSGTLFADGGLDIDFGGGTNRTLDRTIELSGTSAWTSTFASSLNGGGQVVNLGTLNATNPSSITVNPGFDNQGIFDQSAAGTFTFTGVFTNSGTVIAQNGITSFTNTFTQTAGSTELAGGTINTTNPMSFAGGTLIGFGDINGDVSLDTATLSPGSSPDILNVTNLTLTANTIFDVDVDGVTPGVGGHDQVNVTNNATIAGTLNVNLGFVPSENDTFDFITCGGTCTGTFDVENLPANFTVNYDPAFTQLFFSTCTGSICWDGGGGDFFWANALNWSTDALPGVADDVVVDFGGVTVDLDDVGVTHTVSSLFSNDNLTLSDGTLSISNVATINGDLTLAGGNLDGAADVTITGLTSWPNAASTIAGSGTLFATGGLDINFGAGTNRTFSRDIELDGTSTWTASGGSSLFTGAQQVTNLGTLEVGNTGGTITISTTFFDNTATGTIDKNAGAGTLTMSGFYGNSGDFIVGSGGVRLNNANTHTGDFIVGAGAALLVDGATTLSGGSVSGLGSVTSGNPGSVLVVNGPTTYDVGSTTISGGTITFNTDTDTDTLVISGGSTGTLNGSGDVTVSGTTAWFADGTTIGGSGTLFADGGLTLAMAGGTTRTLDRTVQMSGTSAWSTTGLSTVNGNGKFINAGTINATNAGGSITVAPELDNLGTVNVLSGDLILTNNGAHASSFNISGGAVLDFLSGIHDFLDNAVFAGGGQVDVNGATLNLPNAASGLSFSANTTLNASSGSITGVGDVSFDTPGTTHTIDASYNVSGTTTVNGTNTVVDVNSTATFGGLSLQNGGDANLQAANIGALSMGGVGNALTASGALSTTTANLGSGCTVAGTGSWASNGGFSSSGTTIGLGFINTSTMSADSGVTSFTNGYTQSAGLTRLNGGDVTVGGVMNLNGGSLTGTGDINGNVSVGAAAITPGTSPGLLTINGNLTLGAGSVVNAELEGTNPVPLGGQFDVIHVTGTADLNGTLNVSFPSTFQGAVGNIFDILQVDNGFINPNPPFEFNTIAGPVTHTFGASIVPGLLPFGENFQLQILSLLFEQPPIAPLNTDTTDEIVILEQNLTALITQFAISEQEEALQKAVPGVTCK